MSQPIELYRKTGPTVQTVGAATATILSVDVTALPGTPSALAACGVYARGILIGRNSATGDVVAIESARVLNVSGGTLSALGSLATLVAPLGSAALLASSMDINVSGNSIRLQATGIALLTIDWQPFLQLWSTPF